MMQFWRLSRGIGEDAETEEEVCVLPDGEETGEVKDPGDEEEDGKGYRSGETGRVAVCYSDSWD